jgi:hypothetical protein
MCSAIGSARSEKVRGVTGPLQSSFAIRRVQMGLDLKKVVDTTGVSAYY